MGRNITPFPALANREDAPIPGDSFSSPASQLAGQRLYQTVVSLLGKYTCSLFSFEFSMLIKSRIIIITIYYESV